MTVQVKRFGDPRDSLYYGQRLIDLANEHGGGTIIPSGRLDYYTPGTGYIVGGARPGMTIKSLRSASIRGVAMWVAEHLPYIEDHAFTGLGVWTDPLGVTWFDVVTVYPDRQAAEEVGRERGEKAIYDVAAEEDIYL